MKREVPDFLQLLKEYIGFKSVSTDRAFAHDIEAQVEWLTKLFKLHGFEVTIFRGSNTNPVVFAEYHVADDLRTKMIYGHYDVQPARIEEGWKGDPFILRNNNGRLIGRGVVDNKGQNLIHIFTAIKLIIENRLGCNLKFLIEGNEETGNLDLGDQVREYAEKLACDEIIISDGEILGDTPTIEESLRGGGNLTLTFTSAKNDLHSGLYGSGVPSSTKEMVAFLAKMLSPDGDVHIPDFYAAVDDITPEQIERNQKLLEIDNPVSAGTVKKMIGVHDFNTMVGIWPAVEISGLQSGYTGEGYKNIIPAKTLAKINFRLVASQTPESFVEIFRKYVANNVPEYIEYTISVDKMYYPVKVNIDSSEIRTIMELQEKVYGKKPVVRNVGGGIPVVADFKNILGVDSFLVSLGNNDCNMHGTEENFRLDLIDKGLELSELLLTKPEKVGTMETTANATNEE